MFRALRVVSILLASSSLALESDGQSLTWRSGAVLQRPPAGARATQVELLRRLKSGDPRHVLVRFAQSPSAHEQALLAAAGIELGNALGRGAYFARVEPRMLDERNADRLPRLIDAREIALDWKLHPALLAGETPAWTIVGIAPSGEPTVAVYVLLHPGESLESGDELLRSLGGSTFDALESVNGIVAFMPRSRVIELADADAVAWIEPALPQMDGNAIVAPVNDSNRAITQANALQAAPYGLDGTGVKVLVYDAGTARATHNDFGGRLVSRDASGMIDHATHVSATIGGSGAASGGTFKGMAPGVTIESYGFQYDGTGVFLFSNPGDIESDYASALGLGVDIANNSIGTNTESNGFDCNIQGVYGVTDELIDSIVRGSLGSPYSVVWANGNERQGSRCDIEGFGDYYSVAPPATAKNHITIGALNSNDDSMTSFSSWGPTDDGRLKPDVSGPGCQSSGDFGVTSATAASNTSYGSFCGTSMASPTVCGLAALILQDYRVNFGAPDPLNSTLKVILAQTALERGNPGPDYQFGYGSVRAQTAVDFMRLGQFYEEVVDQTGEIVSFTANVTSEPELRVTLAWDDAPGQPNVLGSLVNDLDLVVRDPNGVQRHVWTLNPGAPANNAVQTVADHLNNIEQVVVTAPMSGTWTIEVHAFDVAEGPQSLSIASSHDLTGEPRLRVSFPNGLPAVLTPGTATMVSAKIVGVDDVVVGGSPTLHVRYVAGPFLAFTMTPVGGDVYEAMLPPPACTAVPEFYFTADGLASGPTASPAAAPATTYGAFVYSLTDVFVDDFSTNLGWTVENVSLTAGAWQRGTPVGGGTRGDPPTANGGSGQCYLTQNAAGDTDVDGGPTRLISPLIDLSAAGDYQVSYARWFSNDDADIDRLRVEISNNGGTNWTLVENVPGSGNAWIDHSFLVSDFITPTNQMKVRFGATDNPNDSVTEGGIDDVVVQRRTCPAQSDCNGNGILDSDDIASGRSQDLDNNDVPDECIPPVRTKRAKEPNPPTPTSF